MGEKDDTKKEAAEKKPADAGGEKKPDAGPVTVVLKLDLHCDGCAKKIKKSISQFEGVESVRADTAANKLTVTGKVDPTRIKERVEFKTKKKVDIISPQPKKEAAGEEKKKENPPEKKPDEKKTDDKKPKEGCDASVLLDDTANFTGEQTAGPNINSIRGFNVIDSIKTQLERQCPGVVSCADILAAAARDAVVALRGPGWNVLFGRRDSTTASLSAANSNLPSPASSLSTLISSFSNQGFTANEMIALSGAHTIGQARCTTFRNRLYNDNNINASFAATLRPNCPSSGGDNNLSPLDSTATSFDNRYYNDLISQRGLLHSDQELFNGGSADAQVRTYGSNPATFNRDFASAMLKMSNLGPLTGSGGQVRTNCRRTN